MSPHALVERYDHFPTSFVDLLFCFSASADVYFVFQCLFAAFTVYVCVCTCSSARVCWCEGLKDSWPGTRFSRLGAVTGSEPCNPQTALPSFPITKNNSSFTLSVSLSRSVSLSLTHKHAPTLSFPPSLPLWDVEELSLSRVSHHCNSVFHAASPLPPPTTAHWG